MPSPGQPPAGRCAGTRPEPSSPVRPPCCRGAARHARCVNDHSIPRATPASRPTVICHTEVIVLRRPPPAAALLDRLRTADLEVLGRMPWASNGTFLVALVDEDAPPADPDPDDRRGADNRGAAADRGAA